MSPVELVLLAIATFGLVSLLFLALLLAQLVWPHAQAFVLGWGVTQAWVRGLQ